MLNRYILCLSATQSQKCDFALLTKSETSDFDDPSMGHLAMLIKCILHYSNMQANADLCVDEAGKVPAR